jgi:hypothetical protein
MRTPQHVEPIVGLISTLLLATTMTSCGAENTTITASEETSTTSTGSSSAPSSAAPLPGVLVDARTVADQNNKTCSAPTADTVKETLYSPVLTADGTVTIRDTRAVGHGVQLLDSEGAVVAGDPQNVGAGMSVSWPYDDVRGDLPIDDETRTAFVGMTVDDGQSVLPLWRLAFDPDSHLRGLEIDYDDSTGTVKTLFVAMDATYARSLKGC